MTSSGRGSPVRQNPLLRSWAGLDSDPARAEFLAANPELGDPTLVDALCEESGRRAKSDVEEAIRTARAAERLASLLADERGCGRAFRALANATHLNGQYREAAEFYARALEHFQAREERREEAVTRSSALHNLIYLGDYERARAWAERARTIFEGLGDRLRLARLDLNYANVLYRQDRWEEALALYDSAYETFLQIGDAEDLGACLSNQTVCLISLNRFFRALQVFGQARQLCVERDWPLLLAEVDYNIAYLFFLRGDHTKALEQYREARQRAADLGDEKHLGLCDLDQAEIYIELNLVDEAARLAARAYERFVLLGLRYESAKALTSLAIANSRQGKTFLALDLLGKARDILVKEGNEIWPAVLDIYRASLLFAEGRLFEASRLARAAREVFEDLSVPSKTAACEIVLAKVALEAGDPKAALDASGAALSLLRSLNLPALSYQANLVLGQAEETRGNRDQARRAYQAALVWLERMRSHRQPEDLKIGFSDNRLLVYESLVSVAADEATLEWSGELGAEVFALAERAKARRLANLIAFRASALPAKTTSRSSLVDDIRDLREELNWYYRQIDLGQMGPEAGDRSRVGPLRETSRQQELKLVRTLRDVQRHDQEFGALQDAGTVELERIQEVLPEDAALVQYFAARGAIFAAVVRSDNLHVEPVSLLSRTREIHRNLQFQMSRFVTGKQEADEIRRAIDGATLALLRKCHEELLAPLSPHLDCSSLVVVPDGHLHYLPFHAFFDGSAFVDEHFKVSYAPSASAFWHSRTKVATARNRALVLDATGRREEALEPLVSAVATLGAECEVVVGARATQQTLKEKAAECRIIHIATGASYRQDNPMFSSIELADSGLSFFDLYGLDCKADLIVLTGCGATLDFLTKADELVALAHGLLYSGAKAVALDLWNPEPATSIHLWQSFYQRLAEGGSAAEALRHAARRQRKSYPHPFQWAPTVLLGDPG